VGMGLFPIGIGGGHDLTFPFVRAAVKSVAPVHMVYFDPHLDVREEAGSGMSFRRLVETGSVRGMTIHGFQALANSADLARHAESFGYHRY